MMTMSATACATLTRARPASEPARETFCGLYPDAAHPPIWIEQGDNEEEADAKIDLLIAWEVLCEIRR